MSEMMLHHISLVSKNLNSSANFYREVIGLVEVERPPFGNVGRWFRSGAVEVHLIDRPDGTYRSFVGIDHNDVHFAIRVPNFDKAVERLILLGYQDESDGASEKSLRINRNGKAGYPQLFLIDPDKHVIEINAASI
jgi:glyoxylase I family protein